MRQTRALSVKEVLISKPINRTSRVGSTIGLVILTDNSYAWRQVFSDRTGREFPRKRFHSLKAFEKFVKTH